MTIIKDTLQDIHDLLEEEENWCKGNFAVDESNKIVPVDNTNACRWCILGALMRTAVRRNLNKDTTNAVTQMLNVAVHNATGSSKLSVVGFNDKATHPQLVEMLAWAARTAK